MSKHLVFSILVLQLASWSRLAFAQQTTGGSTMPDGSEEITIASLPDSECRLTSQATGRTTAVPVDDVGIVHVWATRSLTSDRYAVTCNEGGSTVSYEFDRMDSSTFNPATPRVAPTRRKTVPAIANPMAIDPADVRALGYPPRPDPSTPLFKKWLDIVTKSHTKIEIHGTPQPNLHFDPQSLSSHGRWDGIALTNSGRLSLSVGTFTIPYFSSTGDGSDAGMWSGLGGWGGGAIIQDGVYWYANNNAFAPAVFVEYFPEGAIFLNFYIRLGDNVDFWAWEGDANCNYGPGFTGYGCFWFEDKTLSTNSMGDFFRPMPQGVTFSGPTAEGIIERSSNKTRLAQWPANGAFMALDIYDWNWGYHDITNAPDTLIYMTNNSNQSLAEAVNGQHNNMIQFQYYHSL